jgi:hypothetical protein
MAVEGQQGDTAKNVTFGGPTGVYRLSVDEQISRKNISFPKRIHKTRTSTRARKKRKGQVEVSPKVFGTVELTCIFLKTRKN